VNPAPAVGVFLLNDANELAVAVRAFEPGMGKFDVPGGFVDGSEIFEQAIIRELEEETGLSQNEYSPPQYLCSGMDMYEFGNEKVPVLGANFWSRLERGATLLPNDDVAEIRFMPLNDIEPNMFFFSGVQAGARELKKLLS